MISKQSYTDLKEYWDYQRLLEYNKEKLRDKLQRVEGKVFSQFGPVKTDDLFNDIWINIETADLETPPIGWIPKDKKYRFEYMTYNFPKSELDNIRKICYDLGIKYYCINYQGDE
jgi:hypothetical protein